MAKNLPDELDDFFRDTIEPMRELPGEHVWENIESLLDKDDAEKYKNKFRRMQRMTAALVFLLLSYVTISVIYLNNHKSKSVTPQPISGIGNPPNFKKENNIMNDDLSKKNSSQIIASLPLSINIVKQSKLANAIDKIHFKTALKAINADSSGMLRLNDLHDTVSVVKSLPLNDILSSYQKNNTENIIQQHGKEFHLVDPDPPIVNSRAIEMKNINSLSKKFFVTFFAAPEIAAYSIDDDEHSQYDDKQKIKGRENNLLSASAGILASWHLNKHIELQSGIAYSVSNISINPATIYAVRSDNGTIKYQYNTSSGYGAFLPSFSASPSSGDSLFTGTASHSLHYISVPLIVRYRLGSGKLTAAPGLGAALNFLTGASLETEVKDVNHQEYESLTKLEGTRKFSSSLLLSAELQYHISNKWAVSAMPYFKYALVSANKGYIVKTYPYNIGVGVGATYGF